MIDHLPNSSEDVEETEPGEALDAPGVGVNEIPQRVLAVYEACLAQVLSQTHHSSLSSDFEPVHQTA
jgi:hypothetical protein